MPSPSSTRAPESDLIGLPLLPTRLAAELEKLGLSLNDVVQSMKRTLQSEDGAVAVATQNLYFRAATGFAPTKSTSVQMHGKMDKFFDQDVFSNPPPPILDEEDLDGSS